MGSLISPVYLIDYKKNYGDADVKLNYQRKVDVVNLAEIPDVKDYSEGLEFFFEYLKKDLKEDEWNPKINNKEHQRGFTTDYIESAKAIRESYPGWLFLPERYYEAFCDIIQSFPYGEESFKQLDEKKRIDLLYELDWRLRISCSPNTVLWFVTAIEGLDLEKTVGDSVNKVLQLKLTLLSIYRRALEFEKFDALEKSLRKYVEKSGSDKICELYFESCLYRLFKQEFKEVKSILKEWQVSEIDYQGQLWKASILNSIGEWESAVAMLDSVRKKASGSLLKSSEQKAWFDSCIHVANAFLRYYSQKYDVTNVEMHRNADIDLDYLLSGLKLKSGLNTNKGGTSDRHGFRMNEIRVVWDGGDRGFFRDYMYSLRVILLMERLGYPLQVNGQCVTANILEPVLKAMLKYDSGVVISILLRMNANPYLMRSVMTRELMGYVKKEEAQQFYNIWIEVVKDAVGKGKKTSYQDEIVFNALIPIMVKLCVKLDDKEVQEMFEIYEKVYSQGHPSYDRENVRLLYDCIPDTWIGKSVELAFHTQIAVFSGGPSRRFALPDRSYGQFTLDKQAKQIILDAFKSQNTGAVLDAMYRLENLKKYGSKEWLDNDIKDAVVLWRNEDEKSHFLLASFNIVDYDDKHDKKNPYTIINETLERFQKGGEDDSTPSEVRLHLMTNALDVFVTGSKYIENRLNEIITIIGTYLKKDSKALLSHNWENYLGDYGHVAYMFNLLTDFVNRVNLIGIEKNALTGFLSAIEECGEKYPVAQIQAILMQATNASDRQKKAFVSRISPRVYGSRHDMRIDALKAFISMSKNGLNLKRECSAMIQYVGISLNENVSDILRGLYVLSDKFVGDQYEQLQKHMKLLLQRIKEKSFSSEADADITYEGMKLLAKLKDNKKMTTVYSLWRKYVQNPETFRDVKVVLTRTSA